MRCDPSAIFRRLARICPPTSRHCPTSFNAYASSVRGLTVRRRRTVVFSRRAPRIGKGARYSPRKERRRGDMRATTVRPALVCQRWTDREPAMRNKYTTLWIWIFLCPLAMDYRAVDDKASHAAQILLAVPTLAAGAALALIAPRFLRHSGLRSFV